ncbi:MAG: AAA-like domain-containing protein [Acidobacteriota bacterium]|nr:AAA-like domain-containing protein [Acidobacteriota bacterium]
MKTPPSQQTLELKEPGGALGLESRLYIVRDADREVLQAVYRRDSIVLIKGGRQTGKTSLLARGLHEVRQKMAGVTAALTDFQKLSEAELATAETFFKALGCLLAEALGLDADPEAGWKARRGVTLNFERFLRQEILAKITGSLVWGMDEVDRLFGRAYASEVFGLFRAWHNERAFDAECPWQRLTLLMAYATEAHLLITDMNQSPFNIGTRVEVSDFSFEQVAELNRRYGEPLEAETLGLFYELIGGHPYLAQRGLYEVAKGRYTPEGLLARADAEEGPYGEHLRRVWLSVRQDGELVEGVRRVLEGRGAGLRAEVFYRLRSGGVVVGETPERAQVRCRVYERYLGRQLGGMGQGVNR